MAMLKRLSTKKAYLVEFFCDGKPCGSTLSTGLDGMIAAAALARTTAKFVPDEMRITDPGTDDSVCYSLMLNPYYPHDSIKQ